MSVLALLCVDSGGQPIGCGIGGVVYDMFLLIAQMFSLILDLVLLILGSALFLGG